MQEQDHQEQHKPAKPAEPERQAPETGDTTFSFAEDTEPQSTVSRTTLKAANDTTDDSATRPANPEPAVEVDDADNLVLSLAVSDPYDH